MNDPIETRRWIVSEDLASQIEEINHRRGLNPFYAEAAREAAEKDDPDRLEKIALAFTEMLLRTSP